MHYLLFIIGSNRKPLDFQEENNLFYYACNFHENPNILQFSFVMYQKANSIIKENSLIANT